MGNYVNPTSTVRKSGQLRSQPRFLVTTFTVSLIPAAHSDLDDCSWLPAGFPPTVFPAERHLPHESNCVTPLLRVSSGSRPAQKGKCECSARPTWPGFPLLIAHHSSLVLSPNTLTLHTPDSCWLITSSPLNLCIDVTFSRKSTLMLRFQTAA